MPSLARCVALAAESHRHRGAAVLASLRAALGAQPSRAVSQVWLAVAAGHPLACGASTVIAGLLAAGCMQRRDAAQVERSDARAQDAVELGGSKFSIRYDRHCGPARSGRIVVAVRGPEPPTRRDAGELMDAFDDLAGDRRCRCSEGVVTVFDLRLLVWPSLFSISDVLGVLRERPLPAAIRDHTVGVALVHAESAWLGSCVESLVTAVSHLLGAEVVPVCASTREEAEELLRRKSLDKRIVA